jgi:magnesium chelatase family protein
VAHAATRAVALVGVQGHLVDVEADLAPGVPGLALVGMLDTSLAEARDRVRAAVVNSGWSWPSRRITVNLSPAALPKSGAGFDLAIAVALLAAGDVVPRTAVEGVVLVGELALDGRVRSVPGVLPAVLAAAAAGVERVVVAGPDHAEARLVPGVQVLAPASLRELVAHWRGEAELAEPEPSASGDAEPAPAVSEPDLADVAGQSAARRAVEVAAAGGHHVFLTGPPGVGKTMLAERLPGLLPDLDERAAFEVTAVHSVAGVLPPHVSLLRRPPFQAPHHTASVVAIVGGGSGQVRPGAVSLAHRGVLFLDEAPEFAPAALESLRQPLESGRIHVQRSGLLSVLPARFQLVLAANPCPCGLDSPRGLACRCTPHQRRRYTSRLSGPLLDRVDLHVRLERPVRALVRASSGPAESTATVAARVRAARDRAGRRLHGTPWLVNGDVPGAQLRRRWPPPAGAAAVLESALSRGALTERGADRALRVAWTLADLAGRERPDSGDVGEAISLRPRGSREDAA